MNAAEVAVILKAKRHGIGYRACCPSHKDSHPSLWFTDAVTQSNPSGRLRFQCKAGCDFRDIRQAIGLSAGSAPRNMNQPTKINSLPAESDPLAEIVRWRKINKLWERAVPIVQGSPAWTYLVKARRVLSTSTLIPAVMREVDKLGYYEQGDDDELIHVGDFPAIITRMDDVDGNLATLHRTYIASDGSGKAPVEKPKKLMQSPVDGITDGAAIRLFQPTSDRDTGRVILGVAEGIETALAAHRLSGYAIWSAWSSSGLAKMHIPSQVTNLIIFADNDSAGRHASNQLITRLSRERPTLEYVVRLPVTEGADWAAELLTHLG